MYIISKCNVKIDVFSHVDHIPLMAMAISADHELFKKKLSSQDDLDYNNSYDTMNFLLQTG